MTKKAYFIGIAGKTMASLAKAFKEMGWEVLGSDQEEVYPPISDYLKENKIFYYQGYQAANVPSNTDLVVIGRSALLVNPQNPEYLQAKKLGLKVLSYPEVLQKYLIKKESIVVAGTYGKTTISAIIAWILIKANLNPSYMVGGIPLNMPDGLKITSSNYSVVEGDESPALLETDSPKFLFYQPKYLVLTATHFDHPEIFKNKESYEEAFVKLVKLLPKDGLLIFHYDSVAPLVIRASSSSCLSYSFDDTRANYWVAEVKHNEEITEFVVRSKEEEIFLKTILLGKHNLENICAAVALALKLGINKEVIKQAVATFEGVKTRLEFLGKAGGRICYWDFAQHPQKVKATLTALREHYPQKKIFCIFDPAMTGLKYKESLSWYPLAFDLADQVIISKVNFLKNISKEERVTGSDIVKAISQTQPRVFYEPIEEKIIDYLHKNTQKGDIIVFMSSGGLKFTRLIGKTCQTLKD